MVTTFNSKDLVSFGKYLLSEKREASLKQTSKENPKALPYKERFRDVYDSDIKNWKEGLKENPSDLLHEFFNSSSDANKYLEATQQEDLEKDFKNWYDARKKLD